VKVSAITLVEVALDAFDHSVQKLFFFQNKRLIAFLIENGLEEHEDMFFLLFCQK
jgi:hypothetical protein